MDVALITAAALLVFHVPLRGSCCCCCSCAVLFLMTSLGAGLFLSTISQTQQQAMMTSFFFSTPAFMLSGFAFPIRNMPVAVQWLTYLNPLRYFMEIVRGIFLKGAGIDGAVAADGCLAVYGAAVLGPERGALPEEAGLAREQQFQERVRAGRKGKPALRDRPVGSGWIATGWWWQADARW